MAELTAAQQAALDACKQYMHVEQDCGEDEDKLILDLMDAAKEYLDGAGIPEPEEPRRLYTLALHALTLHYYDHRDAVGGEAPLPTGVRPIINQLKHTSKGCF